MAASWVVVRWAIHQFDEDDHTQRNFELQDKSQIFFEANNGNNSLTTMTNSQIETGN